jgi:hypothetical protein
VKKKRISKEELGWVSYAELKAREVLDRAEQRRRAKRATELNAVKQREEDGLRVNRFKARKERRLTKKSNKIVKRFKWDEAVCLLTGAISEAIWHEGGQRDDAIATAELVYHAICRDLHARFEGRKNILPFKRNPEYFRKKVRA